MDELLSDPKWKDTLNGVILAASHDEIIAHKAFGFADRSWGIPNRPDTIFRIASITKFFTAVLVVRLVEDRLIYLGAPMLTYLPDYRPDTGSRITIHHLLSHTSGLAHYPKAVPGFMQNEARRAHDRHEFSRLYCSGDLHSEPGERFHYSNDNYHLLGLVIEAVTGKSYGDALRRYIFDPAGMTH